MTINNLILKPVNLLIHAAKKQAEQTSEMLLENEWLDDHVYSFDEVGRSINGLPIRKISAMDGNPKEAS